MKRYIYIQENNLVAKQICSQDGRIIESENLRAALKRPETLNKIPNIIIYKVIDYQKKRKNR